MEGQGGTEEEWGRITFGLGGRYLTLKELLFSLKVIRGYKIGFDNENRELWRDRESRDEERMKPCSCEDYIRHMWPLAYSERDRIKSNSNMLIIIRY